MVFTGEDDPLVVFVSQVSLQTPFSEIRLLLYVAELCHKLQPVRLSVLFLKFANLNVVGREEDLEKAGVSLLDSLLVEDEIWGRGLSIVLHDVFVADLESKLDVWTHSHLIFLVVPLV